MLRRIKHVRLTDYGLTIVVYRIDDNHVVGYVFDDADTKLVDVEAAPCSSNRVARCYFTDWIHQRYPLKDQNDHSR